MSTQNVLAIDQGTTNTKALLISKDGNILARASRPLATAYPNSGWAEQSADDIWASVQGVIADITANAGGVPIDAIAIANQRETLVVWDAETSHPICPAIIWQCRRTTQHCADLMAAGHDEIVTQATGLQINPLFPSTKLAWVMQNVPAAAELAKAGTLRAGTVDSWLLWKLTSGAEFATDHSNASRTQLFDTQTLQFSSDLCALFGVPLSCLPAPRPSDSVFGQVAEDATEIAAGTPITAMMGDSHAALYGHGVRSSGTVKATYGTGSSLMTLTPKRTASSHGLSGTIAWTDRNGTAHALEGNITVSGQAAAFMAGLIGVTDATALSDLAQTVPDASGVSFVPALAGLGAPHWNDDATGTITGMTHATTPAHLARATIDAITHQIADVFEAMESDIGHPMSALRADGGASTNDFLMQTQADILGRKLLRADMEDVGAFGVAAMTFAASETKSETTAGDAKLFEPAIDQGERDTARAQWKAALSKAMHTMQ